MANLLCWRDFLVAVFIIKSCYGFSLYGMKPVNYCPNYNTSVNCRSDIPVFLNQLISAQYLVPFGYENFDFCRPAEEKFSTSNLGQVVLEEKILRSPYRFTFGESRYFVACGKTYKKDDGDSKKKIEALTRAIRLNYHHQWIIDDMPVSSCYISDDLKAQTNSVCYPSFPVGCYVGKDLKGNDDCHSLLPKGSLLPERAYLFNHVELTIEYHRNGYDGKAKSPGAGHLVKAMVSRLASLANEDSADIVARLMVNKPQALPRDISANFSIVYTYQVTFKENENVKWSSRWDYVLYSIRDANIEWFNIMNSVVIVLFLSGVMTRILLRTIYRDTVCFNQSPVKRIFCSQSNNDPRWMLVQGDVFRPPCGGLLLSVFLGSGVQIFVTTTITFVAANLGFFSPANHGALTTSVLVLFACLGTPAGYVSSRIYKTFGGENCILNVILTACLFPGIVFTFTVVLNIAFWSAGSSAAMSCLALFGLLALWIGVSLPLTFLGAYIGLKKDAIRHPVHTNEIAREIPNGHLFSRPLIGVILGGILPFGCILVQLFYMLSTIKSHQPYFMFGFLFLVFVILVITCSEMTILLCYLHLSYEDYRWWWRSFLTSGFTAFYVFLYSTYYYVVHLEIEGCLSVFIYFGYILIITFIIFLLTGAVGFFACFFFVRIIYGTVSVYDGESNDQPSEKGLLNVDEKEAHMTLIM